MTLVRHRALLPILLVSALGASACGGDDASVAPVEAAAADTAAPTTAAPTTTTAAPTTTAPTTTAAPTTTLSPTTSAAPVTAPAVQPAALPATPVAPPANPRQVEPEVVLGTIEIPKIGVTKTLYQGISLHTLDKGPGHWPGTALPGQPGNVVVGGHRTSHDRPFRNIDQLVTGDQIIYTTDAGRFVYEVMFAEVVTPDRIDIIDQRPGYTTTLFACHPPGSTRYRYIVYASLVGA
jgi:sortase A